MQAQHPNKNTNTNTGQTYNPNALIAQPMPKSLSPCWTKDALLNCQLGDNLCFGWKDSSLFSFSEHRMWAHWPSSPLCLLYHLHQPFFSAFSCLVFRQEGGRPTQPGSSDPRGCCITNITSPLFVYFLPTTTQRTTGLGKAKLKKTVFPTTGANSFSFSSSQGHLIWYVLHQGGKSLLPDFWPWLKPRLKSDPV